MKVQKVKVVKRYGNFYPQYKQLFWWRNFTYTTTTNGDLYPYTIILDVKFENEEEAISYAKDMRYSEIWNGEHDE